MKVKNKIIFCSTKGEFDFRDITKEVESFVKKSKIKNGLVNIQILHTSAALLLNENEPLLLEDIKKNLEKIAPKNFKYNHDNLSKRTVNICPNECINGHAHCKAIHLDASITLNLIKGKIQLGSWQSILLVELDRKKERRVQIQIIGE